MQQKKMDAYRPNYPKKLIRGAALTAAAVMAVGGTVACTRLFPVQTMGDVPYEDPTEEPELAGDVYIDDSIPNGEDPEGDASGRDGEELPLMGKIAVPDENENP